MSMPNDETWFDQLTFVFAKRMPHNPHEYVKRTPENEDAYFQLFRTIREFGVVEKWNGQRYRYWYRGDGFKYWAMTSSERYSWVINRARIE